MPTHIYLLFKHLVFIMCKYDLLTIHMYVLTTVQNTSKRKTYKKLN